MSERMRLEGRTAVVTGAASIDNFSAALSAFSALTGISTQRTQRYAEVRRAYLISPEILFSQTSQGHGFLPESVCL